MATRVSLAVCSSVLVVPWSSYRTYGNSRKWKREVLRCADCSCSRATVRDVAGGNTLNLTKLARLGAHVHTMNLPYVIVGDFNMTPDEFIATQWVDQLRGQIVTPHETVSTCSNGGRMIDNGLFLLFWPETWN